MKKTVYLYLLNSFAEWEICFLTQAFSIQEMLGKEKIKFEIKTVSTSRNQIKSIGGLTVIPDCTLEELDENKAAALLLAGSTEWNNDNNKDILQQTVTFLNHGILVGAICGATLALADLKILNTFRHTSNSPDYLSYFSTQYTGQDLYCDSPACIDHNLVTASSAGSLLWTKYILDYLQVFPEKFNQSWYNYFTTGNPQYFNELISQSE